MTGGHQCAVSVIVGGFSVRFCLCALRPPPTYSPVGQAIRPARQQQNALFTVHDEAKRDFGRDDRADTRIGGCAAALCVCMRLYVRVRVRVCVCACVLMYVYGSRALPFDESAPSWCRSPRPISSVGVCFSAAPRERCFFVIAVCIDDASCLCDNRPVGGRSRGSAGTVVRQAD